MVSRVIVITGTPGVGKTVVSKALAERLDALYISLGDLVKDEKIVLGYDEKRETIIADLDALSKRVRKIISNYEGYAIVEGHYAVDVVSSTRALYVFVLRRDPDDLRVKLKARGYKENKILENVASEVLDVCLVSAVKRYGAKKVDEINMTQKQVDAAVEEILQVLNGQNPVKIGKVNWLGKLEEEGRLEEFLDKIIFV